MIIFLCSHKYTRPTDRVLAFPPVPLSFRIERKFVGDRARALQAIFLTVKSPIFCTFSLLLSFHSFSLVAHYDNNEIFYDCVGDANE